MFFLDPGFNAGKPNRSEKKPNLPRRPFKTNPWTKWTKWNSKPINGLKTPAPPCLADGSGCMDFKTQKNDERSKDDVRGK